MNFQTAQGNSVACIPTLDIRRFADPTSREAFVAELGSSSPANWFALVKSTKGTPMSKVRCTNLGIFTGTALA